MFVWHPHNLAAKESGLECTCINNDKFTVPVSGGSRHFEWACVLCGCGIQNDWVSRATNLHQIWHQTFLLRNYSDDSEGHSYGQLVIGSFIMTIRLLMHHVSCRVFWWNIKSPRWLSPPPPFNFWLFPKLKSLLKGKGFQTIDETQENTTGQLMAIVRTA